MPGQLLGQLGDPLRDLRQATSAGEELLLGPSGPRADKLREVGHQVGDLLGSLDYLVVRVVPLSIKQKNSVQNSKYLPANIYLLQEIASTVGGLLERSVVRYLADFLVEPVRRRVYRPVRARPPSEETLLVVSVVPI